ncbi:hypothetical protein VFPPC_18705 [Pochonia chlamydosporia 170]|uniref:Uncharacterized protein n=1 Tax=Pochonia chlamydosporia 170 TaxID=1380566 RepID=A0A219AS32_METCM|nr:hypothetical protein VFPPC_18705 [Pochonia chlamydosporia 170]OWT43568.1 hypothetical protein VFPPC_18705 [Pochonia chlamydosporia 170]
MIYELPKRNTWCCIDRGSCEARNRSFPTHRMLFASTSAGRCVPSIVLKETQTQFHLDGGTFCASPEFIRATLSQSHHHQVVIEPSARHHLISVHSPRCSTCIHPSCDGTRSVYACFEYRRQTIRQNTTPKS